MPLVKILIRLGDSTGLVLDLSILRQVDIEPDSEVEVCIESNAIVIRPHRYASDGDARAAGRKGHSEASTFVGTVLDVVGRTFVNRDKQARLEAHGWRVGSAEDCLRQKPRLARKRSTPVGRRRRSPQRTRKG